MARFLFILNAVLPGSGLLVEGRIAWGLPLLLLTIPLFAIVVAAEALLVGSFARQVLIGAGMMYGLLAVISTALALWFAWRRRIDPARVRALHREACAAWLQARTQEALAGAVVMAHRLVDAAPEEPGAWRFLARVASDAGQGALARRADARADAIELR